MAEENTNNTYVIENGSTCSKTSYWNGHNWELNFADANHYNFNEGASEFYKVLDLVGDQGWTALRFMKCECSLTEIELGILPGKN